MPKPSAKACIMPYSIPLWIHDLWAEMKAPDLSAAIETPEVEVRWPRVATQAALCGLMFAAVWAYILYLRRDLTRRMAGGYLPSQHD